MIRAIIITLLPLSVSAEGRNDPFMRCTFDDGRVVVLAENAGALEWRENDFRAPIIQPEQMAHDPMITYFGPWIDPERIDVFVGWFSDGSPNLEVGAAMLSRTIITDQGTIESEAVSGLCEAYFG